MGIDAKHYYRFDYLKSEQWQIVRIEALARDKGKCQICGTYSTGNDAHHIQYPESIWDTKADHLVILCRPCHNLVHSLLDIHNASGHSIEQFHKIRDTMQKWWRAQEVAENIILKDMNGNGARDICKVCGKANTSARRLIFFERFDLRKLKTWACPDCFASASLAVCDMKELPENAYKFYERWKKSRRT